MIISMGFILDLFLVRRIENPQSGEWRKEEYSGKEENLLPTFDFQFSQQDRLLHLSVDCGLLDVIAKAMVQ